jgi:hypothetical protein
MNERTYFLRRAETQVALAHQAADKKAARAHYELAGFYWDRAFNPLQKAQSRPAAWWRDPVSL